MAEAIYELPINDAFSEGGLCPMCRLKAAYEEDLLRYYLGPALMEASIRKQTNARGFCQKHFYKLYKSGLNRLGLALILQTHLAEKQKKIAATFNKLADNARKKSFLNFSKSAEKTLFTELSNENSCLFCEALQERMHQYYHSLVHMYANDETIKDKLEDNAYLCVPHAAALVSVAGQKLKASAFNAFVNLMQSLLEKQFVTMHTDLQWYADKHDYRNHDAAWGESKEASEKTIALLLGEEN